MNFESFRGTILHPDNIPDYTNIWVGVLNGRDSLEAQLLREYLACVGWSEERVKDKVTFFPTPPGPQYEWTQDTTELAGTDNKGKTVLVATVEPEKEYMNQYNQTVKFLTDNFPHDFTYTELKVPLPDGIFQRFRQYTMLMVNRPGCQLLTSLAIVSLYRLRNKLF